ncbi:MAG: tol-pal system protein YbgF [Acidobacteria bacterium]|nr:tol-pal system protein YbgF [Acidobacteriota bacterium]
MTSVRRVALAAALLALGAAPSFAAANREHQQLMADLRMLQEQAQQLQALLGNLTRALQSVNLKIDEQANINRKAFADHKLLIDNVAGDVRILREKVDDTNVRLSSLSQEVEALRLAIPAMPNPAAAMATPGTPPAEGVFPPAPSASPPPAGPTNLGVSPTRMFESAWADYAAGQWGLAIQGFEAYLKTFPRSELADDAQYNIGQSYFLDNKLKEAVEAFDRVITGYPNGNLVPEAYYKKGLALEKMGQADRAREAFDHVVKNFPTSDVAPLARQRLKMPAR